LDGGSALASKKYHAGARKEVDEWIQNLVERNGNELDPAQMVDLVGSYYDVVEEEEEEDGGAPNHRGDTHVILDPEVSLDTIMEGDDEDLTTASRSRATTPNSTTTAKTIHSGNDGSDDGASLLSPLNAVPELVRRRQVVLQWLESCHNRSIVGGYPNNAGFGVGGAGEMEKKVMWKDTLDALKRQKRQGGNHHHHRDDHKDKITNFHPDAPLLLLQQLLLQTQQQQKQQQKSSSYSFTTSSSLVNPLYGNDNVTERYLLSTCLSLLKAGRLPEALDLCREYGQSWRAASWGGNTACGRIRHFERMGRSGSDGDGGVVPSSYSEEEEEMMQMMAEERKEEGGKMTIRVGNPKRALWKRTMWKNGRSLHARLHLGQHDRRQQSQQLRGIRHQQPHTDGTSNRSETQLTAGSLVYEAAIISILADDVHSASLNPTLNKTWLDLVWVHYRGIQARFMEQVYHSHNDVRRSSSSGSGMGMFSLEGTECVQSEIEQLDATKALGRLDEETFLSSLRSRFDEEGVGRVGVMEEEADGGALWRDCMSSFLVGMEEVEQFVVRVVDGIVAKAGEGGGICGNEDETLLRFVLHLLLFLDTLTNSNNNVRNDGDSDQSVSFQNETIYLRKKALLLLYVKHLSTQKPLWHLIALYASLLEEDATVEMCTEFWTECVVEDRDRRMVLHRAREYFVDGLDLVILRGVVRSCILEEDDNTVEGDGGEAESSRPFPSSWLHFSDNGGAGLEGGGTDTPLFTPNANLEERILSADVRKMHSIHWLCYHREHAVDALICANILLRKLLLETIGDVNADGTGECECANAETDWLENVKLYTAKIFAFRILPSDIFDEVIMEDGQHHLELSSIDFIRDNMFEHEAMVNFLSAHDAYQKWSNIISHHLPTVTDTEISGGNVENHHNPASLEYEISNKMQGKKYVDKKRHVAHAVIKATEDARICFMEVLTYNGGWLEDTKLPDDGSTIMVGEVERGHRLEEMKLLRSRYIPNAVFLLFHVLDETAQWMEEFSQETLSTFGQDEGSLILSRIVGTEDADDDADSSPFSPGMWYRTALLLANTVANKEYNISSCLNQDELKLFMNYMADSTVSLLRSHERKEKS